MAQKRFKGRGSSPALGTKASSDILGAFFQKVRQISDRFQTNLVKYFKEAELKKGSKDWYVEYQYRIPAHLRTYGNVFKRFRVYSGINEIREHQGDEAAEKYAANIIDVVNAMLRDGFNPFLSDQKIIDEERNAVIKEKIDTDLSLNTALNVFIEEKKALKVNARSLTDYESYLGIFREYMASKGLLSAQVTDIETHHIESFLNDSQALRGWEARTYNNYKEFISSVFNTLIKWSKKKKGRPQITENPVLGIESQISKPSNHRYYTAKYAKEIKEAMLEIDPWTHDLCQFIYYSCTRPKVETRLIKIEDIDMERKLLRVPAGKTGYRYVPICNELAEWLKSKKVSEYPGEYYLFGKNGEISPSIAGINYLTNRYKKIKDALNIPEEYTLYSWKHTRCVDLIMAGLSTIEAMQVTGHEDVDSFEAYIRDLGVALSGKVHGKTVKF